MAGMKPYKGQFQIVCKKKGGGCLRNLNKDVEAGCMDCPNALTQVLDLAGAVIYEYQSPAQKTGTRKKPGKKARAAEV